MKVIIYFPGDPSVGIFPFSEQMGLPFNRSEMEHDELEALRKWIKEIYTELSGGEKCLVSFDFEKEYED